MALNTAAILAKWKRNAGQAAQSYQDGIDAVTTAPTQQAAANLDKYLRNTAEAVNSGRMAQSLQNVTLQDWKQAAKDKGSRNYTTGISAISPRAAKAMADQQQYAEMVKQQVAGMPNNSDADADARMLKAVELMRLYPRR